MQLPSGEVARCIGESATQEAPGEAPEAQRHVGKIVPKSPQHGSQNRSKMGPKRLQNGSLEASGRLSCSRKLAGGLWRGSGAAPGAVLAPLGELLGPPGPLLGLILAPPEVLFGAFWVSGRVF